MESEHVPRTEEVSDPDLQCCHTAADRVPFNRSSVRFGLASKLLGFLFFEKQQKSDLAQAAAEEEGRDEVSLPPVEILWSSL